MGRRSKLPPRKCHFNARTLELELHRQRPDRGREIYDIIVKYARLRTNGRPIKCVPSQEAIAWDDPLDLHSWGKVVFDSEEAAQACVDELRAVLGDDVPAFVYPCRRSRHGHVHLTSKEPLGDAP